MTRKTLWTTLLWTLLLALSIGTAAMSESDTEAPALTMEGCTLSADVPTRDWLSERPVRVAIMPAQQSVALSFGRSSNPLRNNRNAGGEALTRPEANPLLSSVGTLHRRSSLAPKVSHNGRSVDYYIYSLRRIII